MSTSGGFFHHSISNTLSRFSVLNERDLDIYSYVKVLFDKEITCSQEEEEESSPQFLSTNLRTTNPGFQTSTKNSFPDRKPYSGRLTLTLSYWDEFFRCFYGLNVAVHGPKAGSHGVLCPKGS